MNMSMLKLDGVDIAVRGSGYGPAMILVHGTGADGSTWDGVLPGLAKNHRVIDYDRRGYRGSPHSAVIDYRVHGRDLEALIEGLAAGPAVLVGWSSGGTVCLDLASRRHGIASTRHPERHPRALQNSGSSPVAPSAGTPGRSRHPVSPVRLKDD